MDLNEAIRRLETSLVRTPNGNIICKARKLYRVQPGQPEEFLGKDKEPLIRALAQKRYNTELYEALIWEKNTLVRTTNNLKSNRRHKTAAQVWADFPEALKPYITLDEWTDDAFIKKWASEEDNFRSVVNNSSLYTMRGDHVRSKSEILIADRLYTKDIPYFYEKKIALATENEGMVIVKPDFTILNKRTLQTWYWEHFGRLHDERYREEMKVKLDTYGYNKIIPGKNMIITMETSQNQLSTRYIEQLIELYLS